MHSFQAIFVEELSDNKKQLVISIEKKFNFNASKILSKLNIQGIYIYIFNFCNIFIKRIHTNIYISCKNESFQLTHSRRKKTIDLPQSVNHNITCFKKSAACKIHNP